jgi:hypothetical protein
LMAAMLAAAATTTTTIAADDAAAMKKLKAKDWTVPCGDLHHGQPEGRDLPARR